MADDVLLDLDTLIVRPTIAIDNNIYELFSADELSVLASHRFGVWGRRIEQLSTSDSEDDMVELAALIDNVARAAIVKAPGEVLDRLSDAQKLAITDVFTGLLLRNKLGVAGAMTSAMGIAPIGAMPSHASSGSSAERPTGGCLTRLRRWFGRI